MNYSSTDHISCRPVLKTQREMTLPGVEHGWPGVLGLPLLTFCGPFDGILGFSQGSALVALLCCLKILNEFNYNLKFVVIIAGFKSLTTSHLQLFDKLNEQLIDIPSLHIIGETDQTWFAANQLSRSCDHIDGQVVFAKHIGWQTVVELTVVYCCHHKCSQRIHSTRTDQHCVLQICITLSFADPIAY
ncbi:unnamed protein product [Medioppia subpectinata]|uniref:Serine hydrolase domain-containing protein n=1 Tax=Medioppia subpectinata TaxID=1979941 RepID=A0A7R9KP09_9ACAR|nr:unnamed protein product [Medioppia subpectinata]CAG2107134.1 unnamed protein product [Medioppia subpectinata]